MDIIICDDDPVIARKIADYVELYYTNHGLLARCRVFADPQQVLALPDLPAVQLAFLDGDMRPMDGIALGERLRAIQPEILLVYVSSFMEFAVRGYTVNAFRYILKRDIAQQLPACLDAIHQMQASRQKWLTIKRRQGAERLALDMVYYFESDMRKVVAYGSVQTQPICTFYSKMSTLMQQLDPVAFCRISRSYIVHLRYVREIRPYTATLRNGVTLPVGRKEYGAVQNQYMSWPHGG